jgi:DNA ligase-1
MQLAELVAASLAVARTSARNAKIEQLAACLRRLPLHEVAIGVSWLAGELPQGRLGIGGAVLHKARPGGAASESCWTIAEVDAIFGRIGALKGPGSANERIAQIGQLLARATADEQEFLMRLMIGEVRQGALEGVMLGAIAKAADVPVADVRRAAMLTAALGLVARTALGEGRAGLARFALQLFRPVAPMLADTAADPADAIARLGAASLEWKLDGARVQVHKAGDVVRVFTRNLNEVTAGVPEVVEVVRALPESTLILDGEAIALRADGRPQPFQVTMRRFGRKIDVAALRGSLPLSVHFFDCLRLGERDLLEQSAKERFDAMHAVLAGAHLVPRIVTADEAQAHAFFEAALGAGHEGIMAKSLDAPYEAGSRGSAWLKVKRAHTLDLVVLAAEWGHGRRRGWLSNLHLGARDPASGTFVMLGKTFKGLTDELLAWQTRELLAREIGRDSYTVFARPELVVEVAFDGIQASPQYPGGLALRFARVRRYRHDKDAAAADTIDAVRALYAVQAGGAVAAPE